MKYLTDKFSSESLDILEDIAARLYDLIQVKAQEIAGDNGEEVVLPSHIEDAFQVVIQTLWQEIEKDKSSKQQPSRPRLNNEPTAHVRNRFSSENVPV